MAGRQLHPRLHLQRNAPGGGHRHPDPTGNNLDRFCLQIEAFDETKLIAYMQSHGIDCGEFHERNGAQGRGRSLYISDIDGNTVELRAAI